MHTLLDPTNDIVFKLMFSRPDSTELLISLLTAVLNPPAPITRVTILNPDLLKDAVSDRGVVLDLHVEFDDGTRVNVEMQSRRIEGMRQRSIYHVARMFGSQLVRGDRYSDITACVGIFVLGYDELPSARFHSTFELREVHDHVPLSRHLRIHYVELLKLRRALPAEWEQEPHLVDWVRFFRPADDDEREVLAMKDPTFAKAKAMLETLSADPEVRELARAREEGEVLWRMEIALNREKARAEGKAEGKAEGLAEGLASGRAALLTLMSQRFGELPAPLQARIRNASPDELSRWSERLLKASTMEGVLDAHDGEAVCGPK